LPRLAGASTAFMRGGASSVMTLSSSNEFDLLIAPVLGR
jgi:hypothetical protein